MAFNISNTYILIHFNFSIFMGYIRYDKREKEIMENDYNNDINIFFIFIIK
ncbi:hypothetical protein [Flavobacterium jumunjinense]|uniref:hypothetical protein n=1 Tax=Flavobacterium jumunjinense TaxID=998845 RepID=UPI001F1CA9D5|nr:hypothetical protein [Flavobacterium jumunjinense]